MLPSSLVGELEDALSSGAADKRTETLRRVTDLFLGDADRLNEEQIAVFDDVLMHLIKQVETKALVQLSTTVATVSNAPLEVVRSLAQNSEIAVAGPVLTESQRLTETDLIEIAKSRGQNHLLAISQRSSLSESLTDVLLEHGQRPVVHALAANQGACFSEIGLATLVKHAETDSSLAERVGLRLDLPLNLLRQLLARATDIVRSKLIGVASPEQQAHIQAALSEIAEQITLEAAKPRDYAKAEGVVQTLNLNGKLTESVLRDFAVDAKHEEMVATLSLFCGVSTELMEKLTHGVRPDGLIVACKAAKLSWTTVIAIMKARYAYHSMSEAELASAKNSFLKLSQAAAQRTIRFMKVRDVALLNLAAVAE